MSLWTDKAPQESIDDIMRKVQLGNASDSVITYLDDYIKTTVERMISQWCNFDITKCNSDAAVISFHEAYRQAIRAHMLLTTKLLSQKMEGDVASAEMQRLK